MKRCKIRNLNDVLLTSKLGAAVSAVAFVMEVAVAVAVAVACGAASSVAAAPRASATRVAAHDSPPPSGVVVYDLTIKPSDPDAATVVTRFVVSGGKVRIGGATAKRVYLFQDHVMTVIDNVASVVHQLKHATFEQYAAHYDEVLKQLQTAASQAAPDDRLAAEKKVADMKVAMQRMQDTTERNYKLTDATSTVDGRVCRIWEERENDIKHLEFCVVDTAALPGGAQILAGLKTLSEFREGSKFAFGFELANSPWWSDIFRFGGVPLVIHEYRYEVPANEISLLAIHTGVPPAGVFDVPPAYRVEDGPDYTPWYVR